MTIVCVDVLISHKTHNIGSAFRCHSVYQLDVWRELSWCVTPGTTCLDNLFSTLILFGLDTWWWIHTPLWTMLTDALLSCFACSMYNAVIKNAVFGSCQTNCNWAHVSPLLICLSIICPRGSSRCFLGQRLFPHHWNSTPKKKKIHQTCVSILPPDYLNTTTNHNKIWSHEILLKLKFEQMFSQHCITWIYTIINNNKQNQSFLANKYQNLKS